MINDDDDDDDVVVVYCCCFHCLWHRNDKEMLLCGQEVILHLNVTQDTLFSVNCVVELTASLLFFCVCAIFVSRIWCFSRRFSKIIYGKKFARHKLKCH